jgi:Sucrase/ferredoxin-like
MCSESKSLRIPAETVSWRPGGVPTFQALTGMAMSLDTCSPGLSRSGFDQPGFDQPGQAGLGQPGLTQLAARPGLPVKSVKCCADATLMRGEPIAASALHCRRFLLLEVPGPWGRSALDESHMEAGVARGLAAAADANDVRVVLIRRPGRHPGAGDQPRNLAWAIADTSPGTEGVWWGAWQRPADLLGLDLAAALPASARGTGPQRVALVCTNGKRDRCCAVRGRPVAAAIADATGWDAWESSHLGGHRFAATALLLPSGDMFGQLDPDSAVEVLRQFDAGRIVPAHYRGQCAQPVAAQAALHTTAVRLGDFRRGAIEVASLRPGPAGAGTGWPQTAAAGWPATALPAAALPTTALSTTGRAAADLWEVEVVHRADEGETAAYRVAMAGTRLAPALLSCGDTEPKAEVRYEAIGFTRIR